MRFVAVATIAALLLGAACIAPLARTSTNDPGLGLEFGAGLSVYNGHVFFSDSTAMLGFNTRRSGGVNTGPQGAARISYGFRREFGADLTLAGAWGPPVTGDAWGGWLEAAIGLKYRPFRTNNLFFAEVGYPSLALGWAGGFPMNRPEQWSLTARVGTGWPEGIPADITLGWLAGMLPPNGFQLSLGRHLAIGRGGVTLTPQAGVGVGLDWGPFKAALSNVTAGVSLSPALRRR